MSRCSRCDKRTNKGYPLDAVMHPSNNWVCEDCLNPSDEVADV